MPVVAVARRELRRIAHRRSTYILTVVLPVVLFFLLAAIYADHAVTDIPIAVCDNDNTELSRLLIRSMASTKSLKIAEYLESVDDIEEKMLQGRIQGALVIPDGMGADIGKGKPASVVMIRNAANVIIGNLILKDASHVVGTVSAGVAMGRLQARGMTAGRARDIANPIRVDLRSIGNPGYNYENYLIPGMLPFILQLVVILGAVLMVNGERRDGTMAELFHTANGSVPAVIGGKFVAYLGLHCITVLLMFAVVFQLFGVPLPESPLPVVLFLIFFVAVIICLGLLISTLFRDQTFATEVAAFFTVPTFIFSGFTFPLWGMPGLHIAYAQLLPFTHFMEGFIKVFYLGSPWYSLWPEVSALAFFLVVSIAGSAWLLYRERRMMPAGHGRGNIARGAEGAGT